LSIFQHTPGAAERSCSLKLQRTIDLRDFIALLILCLISRYITLYFVNFFADKWLCIFTLKAFQGTFLYRFKSRRNRMSEKNNILVVDDDPDIHEIFRAILEREGYAVLIAADAATARKLVKEKNPDLILLDVMMEDVDTGFTLAEEIGDSVPIIIISSIADSSVKVFDADKLPVRDILQKPVKPDVLIERVKKALA